jgi:hypothetical protein
MSSPHDIGHPSSSLIAGQLNGLFSEANQSGKVRYRCSAPNEVIATRFPS